MQWCCRLRPDDPFDVNDTHCDMCLNVGQHMRAVQHAKVCMMMSPVHLGHLDAAAEANICNVAVAYGQHWQATGTALTHCACHAWQRTCLPRQFCVVGLRHACLVVTQHSQQEVKTCWCHGYREHL